MRLSTVKFLKGLSLAALLLGVVSAAILLVAASGCAKSPSAEVDRLEALYGPTVDQVSDLRDQG
jgi:hypothetical protein